ncbi:MAG: hypothetical protein RLZZ458_78 [Planctomycetota bacterium]|jgi:hypothetical protein
MDASLWNRIRILEKQFVAHKAAASERTGHEIELGRDVSDRLDTLEFNLSRLLLIVQTLVQICRSRNIFTEEEFDSLLRAIDLSDGQADGLLKTSEVPGMRPSPQPTSFLSFLRQAEKTATDSAVDPGAFLAQLERAE